MGDTMTAAEIEQPVVVEKLPQPTAELVRDPLYIHARIQEALRAASKSGERYPAGHTAVELAVLRRRIEELAQDVKNHGPSGQAFIAKLQTIAPGEWLVGATIFTDADEETAVKYAELLQLSELEPQCTSGRRSWRGTYEGFEVSVYGPRQVAA